MSTIDRRKFLKTTSGLLALAAMDLSIPGCMSSLQPAPVARAPLGANERINVAVIGVGGRGLGSHVSQFTAAKNCRIAYVCDPDSAKASPAIEKGRTSNGGVDPVFVQDLRRVMDDKTVHAVSIATCNHWHSLASVWAMQAGKDVYVEKPLSHNIFEGRKVVEMAARTGAVCQAGTQMRSNPALIEAIAFLRAGSLGKIKVSRALCYKTRNSIGHVDGPQQVPSTVDYNLWCGPAPLAPLMRKNLHYDWHWVWDTGNGDIGNQGIHEIDIARWALGHDRMPLSVQSAGGRFGYVDDGQTPNTQIADFDFGPGEARVVIEVRGLNTKAYRSRGVENVVECENGYIVSPTYTSAVAYDLNGNVLKKFDGGSDDLHFGNFLDVVRSRKLADLHAPALDAHRSAVLLHMANVSYRLGKTTSFEPRSTAFDSSPVAAETFDRMSKHLVDNQIPLASTSFTLGRRLVLDAAKERFQNDSQANEFVSREYRQPFILPA